MGGEVRRLLDLVTDTRELNHQLKLLLGGRAPCGHVEHAARMIGRSAARLIVAEFHAGKLNAQLDAERTDGYADGFGDGWESGIEEGIRRGRAGIRAPGDRDHLRVVELAPGA